MNKNFTVALFSFALIASILSMVPAAQAGIKVYQEGDKFVEIGGRIQLQYHSEKPDKGESKDKLFFRRLRPYIAGSLFKDWKGKFQWDMGKSDIAVKDAYMQYKGIKNMKVTIGNAKFPFSREALTSSKKQQTVERTFVGDHNYGTPSRNVGIHLAGHNNDKKITWGFSVANASIDPDNSKLDFDTPVQFDKGKDFSDGWMYGGRVDFHPFGHLKFSQGAFNPNLKLTVGAAAFSWANDNDNLDPTRSKKDVDSVQGFEISSALRVAGLSVDAEYNLFKSKLVESGITGGLYSNSATDLKNWAIKGGYMVMPKKLELVLGYQLQDADNYEKEWTRSEYGLNWFIKKQKIKTQITYRINEDKKGIAGKNEDELFVQVQYVF